MWIVASLASLTSLLGWWRKSPSFCSRLVRLPGLWILPPWRPPCLFSQSLIFCLLQQTNVSLNHNNRKPNLHLVSYLLLATSLSIRFALQLQHRTRLFSRSRLGPDSSGLAYISCHFPLPCPGDPAAVLGSLLPHQNLTGITSPKTPLTVTNQATDSHLCWQNIFKIDFSKATA